MRKLLFLCAVFAALVFSGSATAATAAPPARLPIVLYADDGGSGFSDSIGQPCYPVGAAGVVWNPHKGRMVPAICELGPGGVIAIWVDVEGN